MFCFILLQHLFYCRSGFIAIKIMNSATILQVVAGLLQHAISLLHCTWNDICNKTEQTVILLQHLFYLIVDLVSCAAFSYVLLQMKPELYAICSLQTPIHLTRVPCGLGEHHSCFCRPQSIFPQRQFS